MSKVEFEPQFNSKNEIIPNQDSDQQKVEINAVKFGGPVEKPKTANKAFGGISDFLLFFENRNPEMKKFVKDFQEIEKEDSDLSIKNLNLMIVPQVDGCVNAMYKKSGTKRPNRYAGLFASTFETWERFYNTVLKAYTISGFLFDEMNKFLRNEDWEKLDDLLPYTYSLFKAFIWGHSALKFSKHFEFLRSMSKENKLILFRGADFDDQSLKFYDKTKKDFSWNEATSTSLDEKKYFSWNGVTSTSLDENTARSFQYGLSSKTPVLITIEVDFADLNPQDLNALYLEEVSNHPKEREVALAPGSIFELLDKLEGESEVQIKLKLVTNAKVLAHKGQFMHGMLQAVMGAEDELKIVCLKERELSRAIKHCKGNRLTAKLEFALCNFNQFSAEIFLGVLPTLKNLNSFMLNSVVLEGEWCLDQILKCLGNMKIKKLVIANSLRDESDMKSLIDNLKYFGSLKIFQLSLEENFKKDSEVIRKLLNEANQHLDSKCILELNFRNDCDILVKGLKVSNFKQRLASMLCPREPMTYELSTNKVEEYFHKFQGIDELKHTETTNPRTQKQEIQFPICESGKKQNTFVDEIEACQKENDSIKEIAKQNQRGSELDLIGVKGLFKYSYEENSVATKTLLEALKEKYTFSSEKNKVEKNIDESSVVKEDGKLEDTVSTEKPSVEELNLNFEESNILDDKDLESLGCGGIQYLQSLTSLNLNLSQLSAMMNPHLHQYSGITDKALKILSKNAIEQLKGLKKLSLNFNWCFKVTDEGLKHLSSDGLQGLQFLTALNLSFHGCKAITDQGLMCLSFEGIVKIKSLTSLELNFNYCVEITDKGFENLFCEEGGIQNLDGLSSLSLSFNHCSKITNKGIQILSEKGLQNLRKSLTVLNLSFYECEKITDEGLQVLFLEGIKHLERLNTLYLRFGTMRRGSSTVEITNKGLKSLGFQGIQHLPELRRFGLDIEGCQEITDEGLEHFCKNGIQHLQKLTELELSFDGCKAISDQGLQILCSQGFSYLADKLEALYLGFCWCIELLDVGLKSLWKGLRHLSKLKILSLRFDKCPKITIKGLQDLCDECIRYLPSLAILHLNFSGCLRIKEHDILFLQQKINLLNLPQLRLSFSPLFKENNWRIYSPPNQNTASIFCQDRLGFTSQLSKNLQEEIEYQKDNGLEKLTLKFDQGYYITDFDISSSIFTPKKMTTFKDLKALYLNFDGCAQITDLTLHHICSRGLQYLESLMALHLSFDKCGEITNAGFWSLGSGGFKYLKKLAHLNLKFDGCDLITDKGFEIFWEIQNPELLNSLSLSFSGCKNLGDQGLIGLCRAGIQRFKFLTFLSLNFDCCKEITNKGIMKLYDSGIKDLEALESIYLSFELCVKVTEKGLKRLYHKDMKLLKPLKSFFLNFYESAEIAERRKRQTFQSSASFIVISKNKSHHKSGISKLKRRNLGIQKNLDEIKPTDKGFTQIVANKKFLQYIGKNHHVFKTYAISDLQPSFYNFNDFAADFYKISVKDLIGLVLFSSITTFEERVKNSINKLYAQELKKLQSLTSLHLILGRWEESLTDSTLNNLCLKVLKHLESLTTLYLSFDGCSRITNAALMDLGSAGIRQLKGLTALHLSFDSRVPIGDVELKSLCSEGLQHLKCLTVLHLSFKECDGITDVGLESLWTDGILHLELLTILEINFEKCNSITGYGFMSLNRKETGYLKSLTTLHLNFDGCANLYDEGLESLSFGVLQHLKELNTLHLSFNGCEQITDDGLEYLNLKYRSDLKLITTLYLSFDRCRHITGKGIQSLDLDSFKLLTRLHLNFDQCEGLTDQVIKSLLGETICQLNSLKTLHLSFRGCYSAVTDQVLKGFKIRSLILETLYLCFDGCKQITDEGIEALCSNGIQALTSLRTLRLSFGWCQNITQNGLNSLYNDGIKYLIKLANIHICFIGCKEILPAQLSFIQSQISLLNPQLHLDIKDNTIFSKSNSHYKHFLGATISSPEYSSRLKVRDEDDIFDESFKDRFYTISKVDVEKEEAILQKLEKRKAEESANLKIEDSFHVNDLGIAKNCSYCPGDMENFQEIETLNIIFEDFSDITTIKIQSFCCDVLQCLGSLKNLTLNFETCSNITDDELQVIASDGIKPLVNLTQLHLSFSGCRRITDKGLISLGSKGIQNLKNLNSFHLNLSRCDQITDKGFTSLCSDGIQYLRALSVLHLIFDECSQITDEALKSVSLIGILNLSSIQDLKLSFSNCSKISSSSYQAFLKILVYFGYVGIDRISQKGG